MRSIGWGTRDWRSQSPVKYTGNIRHFLQKRGYARLRYQSVTTGLPNEAGPPEPFPVPTENGSKWTVAKLAKRLAEEKRAA
jgi:hypothetical protein